MMEIKVFGSGCASCKKLHQAAQDAVKELGVDADVIYVTDMMEISKAGIMHTPGLMIDGKIKSAGRVPSVKEVRQMVRDEMQGE